MKRRLQSEETNSDRDLRRYRRHVPGLTADLGVPNWVYTDPEIFARENERVFGANHWLYVCLEAEIPNPGDFKRSRLGTRDVVAVRDGDGAINVLVNRCAHRSAIDDEGLHLTANFALFQTMQDQPSELFLCGHYQDRVVDDGGVLRFAERLCIHDSTVVPISLVYPI